ncbi:YIP1 family protein [Pseudodesulfovibrio sp.]|uniref:YIP1 family protein n=1 Tax=Pseudodesulfovibrio sp. TaxID=2035812 RepID=UPI002637BF4F|nr:YIP1 family protein [Pseudodesulfovibrio sp.]MDD3310743.1 YIP1 family protein [Pseudodesulfovibrio sp.]
MESTCTAGSRISIREYFEIIINVMRSPVRFFEGVGQEEGMRRPLLFLMISALFFCSVSMTYFFENSLMMGFIMMLNAILMPAFGAVITFTLLGMTGTGKVPFAKVFNIYAYSSGAVMVVSWIPGLAIIMEPVRALLIGIGLVKAAGVGKIKAALVIVLTAAMILIFFWSAAPVIEELKPLLR